MHEQTMNVLADVDYVCACRNAINAKPRHKASTTTDENALQTRQKRTTIMSYQENKSNKNRNHRHVIKIAHFSAQQCERHSTRTKQVAELKPSAHAHESMK
jgi:hypothetical protein